ncbi:hypothetical protein E2562_035716 [Oryza meyeriana var. granulata]|uniref:Uncharacterized protein n=1 Tax=Oryza meyeriana var. granulata TaxID=110450 RepID=A0A6G1C2Y7_9ORYZ|nr:hypothetical protein E2562_035716 [Oryza meyeriana var. granulata]
MEQLREAATNLKLAIALTSSSLTHSSARRQAAVAAANEPHAEEEGRRTKPKQVRSGTVELTEEKPRDDGDLGLPDLISALPRVI